MSMTLASNLTQLTYTARSEHHLATVSAVDALVHALACGEALLEIQKQVPSHEWEKWLKANIPEIGLSTSTRWMRVATYREQITHDGGPKSIDAAVKYLRENNLRRTAAIKGARRKYSSLDRAEAERLQSMGLSYNQIAEAVGCSRKTVTFWLDDEAYDNQKRATKAWAEQKRKDRALLARARIDDLARHRGGDLSVVYSSVRKMAQLLQNLIDESAISEEKDSLRAALYHLHETEGDIVKALRIASYANHPSILKVQ